MESLVRALARLQDYPWAITSLQLLLLALVVLLCYLLTSSLLVRAISRVVHLTPARWDNALLEHAVISRLAHIPPALVARYGMLFISGLPATAVSVIRGLAGAYVALAMAQALSRLLDAVRRMYEEHYPERARLRPIKGYLQLARIAAYLITTFLVIALIFDRDPLLLLSGLGAMTAVLLLVFKDTILSLVASVQLASNDMLRVGDWIEMPQLHADGSVIDISLHTVKVQNWDHTITTIPTWRLIGESFRNWRGMFDSGGRRIKRSLFLDQTSIRFLTPGERNRLRRFALIDGYLERKRVEIAAHNSRLIAQGRDPVNTRRVTNVGTFRAYVLAYLQAHPGVHQQMILQVRQLPPGPTGLPLEIYCFSTTTAWEEYESVQSDIFDHLYAILPEFGLRVFQQPSQQPSGAASRRALSAHAETSDSSL